MPQVKIDREQFINDIALSVYQANQAHAKGNLSKCYELLGDAMHDIEAVMTDLETELTPE